MMPALRALIRRDLLLAWRRRTEVATAVLFFVVVASLFPFGIGPEPNQLRAIGPGVIWVAALLASMLSLARLFEADHADGALDAMLLSATPLGLLVLARLFAHWLVSGLPVVALSPLLALQYALDAPLFGVLAFSLLLGTPVLSLLGAIGAALTLGLRGGGVLLALLVLPLYIPVLVLGAGAVETAAGGLSPLPHLLLLGALLTAGTVLAPWAIAASLRISAE